MIVHTLKSLKYIKQYLNLIESKLEYIQYAKGKEIFITSEDIWLFCRRDINTKGWYFSLNDERNITIRIFKTVKETQLEAFLDCISFLEDACILAVE